MQSFILCGLFSKAVRLNTILLIFYYLLTHCCCRSLVVVVVVSVPLSLLASRKCWRRLLLFLLSDSHCLCWRWRLVVISVSSMAAAVSLLMASFFDFVDFFSLLLSVLSRHCWRCVVIVGGGVPYLGCFCRLWRLVVEVVAVGVLSLLMFHHFILFFLEFSLKFCFEFIKLAKMKKMSKNYFFLRFNKTGKH